MLLDFIRKVSKETLEQVLEALVAEKVLSASERKAVVEKNHTRVNKASCLVDLMFERGAEDCQKVLHHLQSIDPALHSDLRISQQALFKRIRARLNNGKAKDGEEEEEEEEKGAEE
ncbi:caspase recruitment domain-containing protein 18-like [Fundulus diaphanus]